MLDWAGWLIYDAATYWEVGNRGGCAGCGTNEGGGGGAWPDHWFIRILMCISGNCG